MSYSYSEIVHFMNWIPEIVILVQIIHFDENTLYTHPLHEMLNTYTKYHLLKEQFSSDCLKKINILIYHN